MNFRLLRAAGSVLLAYQRMRPRGPLSPRVARRIARVLERRYGKALARWPLGAMSEQAERWPVNHTEDVIRVAVDAHRRMMGNHTKGQT